MISKHLGEIYEGRWKVISVEHYNNSRNTYFVMENMFNGETIQMNNRSFMRIYKGEITVSTLIRRKIYKRKKYGGNSNV